MLSLTWELARYRTAPSKLRFASTRTADVALRDAVSAIPTSEALSGMPQRVSVWPDS